ncbi:MAG: hypothetical protein HY791_14985 [Deltaproteobacteria bacterium]|nr:hypothetical protein [Deltaproteobacteria bacterium]
MESTEPTVRTYELRELRAGLALLFLVACADETSGLDCPVGAAAFRNADESWCKLSDGVAHGPYEKRDAAQNLLVVGAFDHGLADGVWHRFAPRADEGYAQGRPHGHWTVFDPQGSLSSDHFWAYGEPCGTWRELSADIEMSRHEYGDCDGVAMPPPTRAPPLAAQGDFGWDGESCPSGTTLVTDPDDDPRARFCASGDVKQGPFGRWHVGDGTKAAGGEFSDGVASGLWREWYPSGSVREEGSRIAGARSGPWRTWNSDRSLESEGLFAADLRDGRWTTYWPHGTKRSEGEYRADSKNGPWRTWWQTGIPNESQTWRVGVREGSFERNYPSGVRAARGEYTADQRTGAWTTWHDNGIESSSGDYVAGLPQGRWETWDRDALRDSDGPFVDGLAHGIWSFWRWQSGERVQATGLVSFGELQGPWSAKHDPGGEPAGDVTYVNGLREGPATTIWKNGRTSSEGSYLAGEPHGRWKFQYASGQLFLDCGFVRGRLHGAYSEYWENGQLKAQGTYSNGAMSGEFMYWTESGEPK